MSKDGIPLPPVSEFVTPVLDRSSEWNKAVKQDLPYPTGVAMSGRPHLWSGSTRGQGPVSWRPTTVKWRQFSQSNRHSTIGTRQTEYHEALPSSRTCSHTLPRRSPAMVTLHVRGLPSAHGGMTVGLWRLSSLDGRRPPWYRPLVTELQIFHRLWNSCRYVAP